MGRTRKAESVHPRFSLDVGDELFVASALQLTDGVLLVDSEVELEPGTQVSLVPLDNDLEFDLYELEGRVLRSCPDILVSAYARNRFLISISLQNCPRQLGAAQHILEDGKDDKAPREFAEPHRGELLELDFWSRSA